jgi:hypothetical protein
MQDAAGETVTGKIEHDWKSKDKMKLGDSVVQVLCNANMSSSIQCGFSLWSCAV